MFDLQKRILEFCNSFIVDENYRPNWAPKTCDILETLVRDAYEQGYRDALLQAANEGL